MTQPTQSSPVDFATQARQAREARKLTREQLAKQLGIDTGVVADWESHEVQAMTPTQQATVLDAIREFQPAFVMAPPIALPGGILSMLAYLATLKITEGRARGTREARTRLRVLAPVAIAARELSATPERLAKAHLELLDAALLAGLTLPELREVLFNEMVEA
jgi:transcriptional regulator with XRE-family HTH domain